VVKLNKTVKIGLGVVGAVALMVATIFVAIWISHIESDKAASAFPKCVGQHAVHEVVIQNDKVVPSHTSGKRCDILVITNLDDIPRIMAFGDHEHHVAYDGVTERYLSKDGKLSVTLVQPGNFLFHDHDNAEVKGTFSVLNDR
jgi:hypothetical protein